MAHVGVCAPTDGHCNCAVLCCAPQTMEQYVFVHKALLDELSVRLKGSSNSSSSEGDAGGEGGSGGSSGNGLQPGML